ncbi:MULTISPECIES: SMEK domain-containing protein [unclassified Bacillus cereus group]|uniref:SMEK domain-containing protein n=1 Tax=unclassified Bacillus cereus group TaxID=2750818 RepID=UPI001F57B6E5
MLTRGKYIAEIVDSLAQLTFVLDTRGQLGIYDLNKFCEDFAKGLLNLAYSYNLKNLNEERSNEPGLDLGDEINKIGIQVTTVKKTKKVTDTLKKITDSQKQKFDEFKILILGKKQQRYEIKDDFLKSLNFDFQPKRDILDISDIEKQILSLPLQELEQVYEFVRRETLRIYSEWNMETAPSGEKVSFLKNVEKIPDITYTNCNKIIQYLNEEIDSEFSLDINNACKRLFETLKKLPRVTRETFYIFVLRSEPDSVNTDNLYIRDELLKRVINVPLNRYYEEISLLEDSKLIYIDEDEQKQYKRLLELGTVSGSDHCTVYIKEVAEKYNLSLEEILVDLNFSLLSVSP